MPTKIPPLAPVSLPAVFATAGKGLELFTFNRNLGANLAAVIRAAVARSASADDAAHLLGLDSSRELFRLAAKRHVRLPWRPRPAKTGGR